MSNNLFRVSISMFINKARNEKFYAYIMISEYVRTDTKKQIHLHRIDPELKQVANDPYAKKRIRPDEINKPRTEISSNIISGSVWCEQESIPEYIDMLKEMITVAIEQKVIQYSNILKEFNLNKDKIKKEYR